MLLLILTLIMAPFLSSCERRSQVVAWQAPEPAGTVLGYSVKAKDGQGELWHGDQCIFTGSDQECHQELAAILSKEVPRGKINLRLPTFGGKQFWRDCLIDREWRIQQHVHTGHFRLLDARNHRRAWGSYAACRLQLLHHMPPSHCRRW